MGRRDESEKPTGGCLVFFRSQLGIVSGRRRIGTQRREEVVVVEVSERPSGEEAEPGPGTRLGNQDPGVRCQANHQRRERVRRSDQPGGGSVRLARVPVQKQDFRVSLQKVREHQPSGDGRCEADRLRQHQLEDKGHDGSRNVDRQHSGPGWHHDGRGFLLRRRSRRRRSRRRGRKLAVGHRTIDFRPVNSGDSSKLDGIVCHDSGSGVHNNRGRQHGSCFD
mmetsp:Transcript_13244/g.28057  ORF Transcript_13244/g.28057 Transcript_13244/m.28057 type:complete len:222 (-) Transcript_13244:30-695(-)